MKLLLYQIYTTGGGEGFCAPKVVEAFKIAGKVGLKCQHYIFEDETPFSNESNDSDQVKFDRL